ncbi:MAG: hypothetical protein ACETWE_03830, partial [Candidatus Bathyarchaeia archaeon]
KRENSEVKCEMAYNMRKIVAYGGAAVITATIMIVAFVWAPFTAVGLVPIVELESVTPGIFAITVITDKPDIDVTELKLTIDRLEVKPENGDWTLVEIPGGRVSFDLLRRQGTFIDATTSQLEPGTMMKMHIVQGSEYTNATLNNGDVVILGLPWSEEIEVKTPIAIQGRVVIIQR